MGNGPSAARLLPTIPEGASVLCLNDAVFHARWSTHDDARAEGGVLQFVPGRPISIAVFTLDKDWVRVHKAFLASFHGERHVALPLKTWPDCGGIPGVRYYGWSHAEGLSDDPEVIATGQNSGYGAINLCYLMGAKVIHLVGYDMDPARNPNYRYWAAFFAHALPQLEARGVRVINHNRESHVMAFPFAEEA